MATASLHPSPHPALRTSLRSALCLLLLAPAAAWQQACAAAAAPYDPKPPAFAPSADGGGGVSIEASGRNAFSFPFPRLSDAERTRFAVGNSFFRRNWVEAPASTGARDGLGPLFIARSCGGCHVQDGRGAPPAAGEQPVALLLRLSVPGRDEHGAPVPEPTYGEQFHNAAVQGVPAEGRVKVAHEHLRGRFADGTPYVLSKPRYGFADLAYGPMAAAVRTSPRIAPQLVGVGLIDAIPAAEIERNVAEQAALVGPVKGAVNRVFNPQTGTTDIGRFGWKANVATLAQQTAAAFAGDIGITSDKHRTQPCTPRQTACLDAPSGGKDGAPEIDDRTLADVVFYQAALAAPAQRHVAGARGLLGRRMFDEARCSACHRPHYVTGPSPTPDMAAEGVAGRHIWPYTDLLLHDMGDALADGRDDFLASGRQWRTPPLWGIGLIRDVNGHQRLLHDGRARGVLEAILWHGGEAEGAKQQVLKMKRAEREALVRFVESL